MSELATQVIEAYRWQRGLGRTLRQTPGGRIVLDVDHPNSWDANHVDTITAASDDAIAALFEAAERALDHAPWRVFYTDPLTPDTFTARLAMNGYEEQAATIQMVCDRTLPGNVEADIAQVCTNADWAALVALEMQDHLEDGKTTEAIAAELAQATVAANRQPDWPFRYQLARVDGLPAAFGAYAAAPSGVGMIEDLFTLPAFRRRGLASALIGHAAAALRAQGCERVFIGALAGEAPRHLYAQLGFKPLLLTRRWVRHVG